MQIGSASVGVGRPCFLIAEAGSNHDGSLAQALRLIDAAVEAGADAVKFQTFRAATLYPRSGGREAPYLKALGIDQPIYDLIKGLEMPEQWIPELAEYCARHEIIFLSTPFDEHAVDALDPYVPAFKIASYELTHIPLIRHAARTGKPLLLSTGGGNLDEIREAVDAAHAEGNQQICVMQCTAHYPAPLDSIDVRALDIIQEATGTLVGLSDHSTHPYWAPVAAVARGACVIEKHFTLSRSLPGPDHSYALEPDELRLMVESVREVERALGRREKGVRDVELELVNYRRSIFTLTNVRRGERFGPSNVAVLRRPGIPDSGLHPRRFQDVLAATAAHDIDAESILGDDDVRWAR